MKCINKFSSVILILCVALSTLSGCGDNKDTAMADLWMPFSEYTSGERVTTGRSSIIEHSEYDNRIDGFSKSFTVFSGNVSNGDFENSLARAALLIDLNDNEVLYADNAFEKMYPASITKLMTALLSVKYLSKDSLITVTAEVNESITDPTAVMLELEEGDYMTLDQALRLMLLSSYNDVAVAIGCQISGSVEAFGELMTEEAKALGCTGTSFKNASGLHDDDHYTTAYDLYLIFKEVIKDPYLLEIIQMKEYNTVIHYKDGTEREVGSVNTNRYFRGTYEAPSNIYVVGGKTGSTEEAGRCLMIMVRDTQSNPYIAVVLGAENTPDLYTEMTDLLSLCESSVN